MMTRMQEDPGINRQTAIVFPRMSFFMDGMTYAADRKSTTTGKFAYTTPANTINWQYKEVPYDFHFSLYIYVKNVEDANKMLEQILPFFTPQFTIKAFLIPNRPSLDLPMYLKDISHSDTDSNDFKDRSIHVWELHFTMKGYLWGPVQTNWVIDTTNVSIYYGTGPSTETINNHAFGVSNNLTIPGANLTGELDQIIYSRPGLDASGKPTNLLANSIPLANITFNENWGVISIVNSTPYSN